MSIISCPECSKDISNKAVSCPNCGVPIKDNIEVIHDKLDLVCPDLPESLYIDEQITNWTGDAYFKGKYRHSENVVKDIEDGDIQVLMHKEGISIGDSISIITNPYEIHFKQIISVKSTTTEEVIKEDKSVISRAVLGGLVLGPLGAVIGGMSGVGTKDKTKNHSLLVINFWDLSTRKPQSILIDGLDGPVSSFAERIEIDKEKTKDLPIREKTGNEEETLFPPITIAAIIVIIVIILIVFLL